MLKIKNTKLKVDKNIKKLMLVPAYLFSLILNSP